MIDLDPDADSQSVSEVCPVRFNELSASSEVVGTSASEKAPNASSELTPPKQPCDAFQPQYKLVYGQWKRVLSSYKSEGKPGAVFVPNLGPSGRKRSFSPFAQSEEHAFLCASVA